MPIYSSLDLFEYLDESLANAGARRACELPCEEGIAVLLATEMEALLLRVAEIPIEPR